MKQQILILIVMFLTHLAHSQCTNSVKYPPDAVSVSDFKDTVIISSMSFAGDYMIIVNLKQGVPYTFTSSIVGDYFTIRDAYDFSILLGQGNTPYTFTPSVRDIVSVHLNLTSPPCGTEDVTRTTKVICDTCDDEPGGVGININTPEAALDIFGELKIGNSIHTPEAGMIRWNSDNSDFEGYNGNKWLSLTKSSTESQWGQVPINEMNPDTKIISDDGATLDHFGSAVSINGDYAIIGAANDDIGSNTNQGSAYIFHRTGSTWTQQAKLVASDGASGDGFGRAVSIQGDHAIIGAAYDEIGNNTGQGSAYIFHRTGSIWTQQAKLVASDGASSDVFGIDVYIDGEYAIIGAYLDDIGSNIDQGSAYIFHRTGSTWTQQAKLVASDGASGDVFGNAVSIQGDYTAIGAKFDDIGSNANQGSAYIFYRTGSNWTQQAKLVASDGAPADNFGNAVSIYGDYALIGAQYNDIGSNTNQGSAYIFHRTGNTWTQQAQFMTDDGKPHDNFGTSVSISDVNAFIGSPFAGFGGTQQGAVYFFKLNGTTWIKQTRFFAKDGVNSDLFGASVCISNSQAIIGASYDNIATSNEQGSAYIVEKK